MFNRFGGNLLTPIGLDIGSHCVKAVQLRRIDAARAKWTLAAATVLPRLEASPTPTFAEATRWIDVLDRQGFRGRRTVVGMPARRLIVSTLELPPRSSGAPIEQLARAEIARVNKCAPDAMELSAWDLPQAARAAKGTQLMAVGCTHAIATEFIDPLESAGFDVCALDATFLAAARASAGRFAPESSITATLDVGWNDGALVLFRGQSAVYMRSLAEAGVGRLISDLSERLNVEPEVAEHWVATAGADPDAPNVVRGALTANAESIVRDLQTSFAYVAHQYPQTPVAKLLLLGGGATTAGLSQTISQALATPVEVAAAGEEVDCPKQLASLASSGLLATAIGLALHPEQ